MSDPRNAFISLVEPPPGAAPLLPEGDHEWLAAELEAYLSRGVSPLAVAIALLPFDFDDVAPLWAALAGAPIFQSLLREPIETHDAVIRAAFTLVVGNAEQLDQLAGGQLWPFLSVCRVVYYTELLTNGPGAAARLLLARHLVSHPGLVGAGWGDGPTAVNTYLSATGDEIFAANLLALPAPLPESVHNEIERRFPHLYRAPREE